MRCLLFVGVLLLGFATGCKTYSYFRTPNDVMNYNASIFMVNGSTKVGNINVQFETGQAANSTITYIGDKTTIEKIPVDSILYFTCNGESYYPKRLNLDAFEIPYKDNLFLSDVRNLLFLKKLTPPQSKIDLFELYQTRMQAADGMEHFYYFVSFKGEERLTTWNIGSSRFIPKFDEKMSALVADCPALAEKIKQKQKGFFVNQISIDLQKLSTFKHIIEAYNQCN